MVGVRYHALIPDGQLASGATMEDLQHMKSVPRMRPTFKQQYKAYHGLRWSVSACVLRLEIPLGGEMASLSTHANDATSLNSSGGERMIGGGYVQYARPKDQTVV